MLTDPSLKPAATAPLIDLDPGSSIVSWRAGRRITREALFHDAICLAESLPERSHVANYCVDRYNFLVAFLAAMLRGQITCLPNDRTTGVQARIADRFPGLYGLGDAPMPSDLIEHQWVEMAGLSPRSDIAPPNIATDRVVAQVFTSGTTGQPEAHAKTWGALFAAAQSLGTRFGLRRDRETTIIATVPAQHMYGLETIILMPLICGVAAHAGHPFYPADIQEALAAVPESRILATTPTHLRALVKSGAPLPKLDTIVSATANLSADLASRAEDLFGAHVLEIFGFTEVGSLATRRTVEGDRWRVLDEYSLHHEGGVAAVSGTQLNVPVAMSDVIELCSPQEFVLRGRAADLVNIAGKRTSLAGLNAKLSEIDGIVDGTFYLPPEDENGKASRLIVIAVAPQVPSEEIKRKLSECLDPAFVPRRIYHVPRLPRNAVGKLPLKDLATLVQGLTDRKLS